MKRVPKRVPVKLPVSHDTITISERVLATFDDALTSVDEVYVTNPEKVFVESANEILLSGLGTVDDVEWRSWTPKQREQFLISLLGSLDALLMLIILQQSGLSPSEVAAVVEEDFATLH